MTESESKSHWQSLAAEIGAEIPNEPEPQLEDDQQSETAAESRTDPPAENLETLKSEIAKPPRRTPPPAPARPANHWSLLAGELGLEVPEEPELIEPAPETPIDEPANVLNSDADEPHRVSPAADDDAVFASPPEVLPSDKPSEVPAGGTDVTTASESLADEFDDMSSEQGGDDLELPDAPVSASGDADEQPDEGRKRRKRRGRRRRRRGEDASESPEETETEPEPETIKVVTVGSSEPEEIEVVAVRDFEDEEDESDEGEDEEAESAEGKERRGRRRRRRRGARRPRERDETSSEDDKGTDTDERSDSEDHEPESEDSEEDESGEERRTKHRKIPSWQEAVAGMIDSNVKNHASNENSGRRGRGKRGR